MTIQERGDALLTAYVNKDFETVKTLWCAGMSDAETDDGRASALALHRYSNPSITDTGVNMAVVYSVNATRDYEAEGREQNEINAAKRKLWSLGYNEYLCPEYGSVYWSQTMSADRLSYESDPRKVLESLKK